jgi:hypothetical protein
MSCPVCSGKNIPEAIINKKGRIALKGTIHGIGISVPPFRSYFTVALSTSESGTVYLVFDSEAEANNWGIIEESRKKQISCEGCLHQVFTSSMAIKYFVFDITNVKFL